MLAGIVRTMRPHQWVKNLFVLLPLVFAKELFDPALVVRAAVGFFSFCLLSSAVYVMNDIIDVEADRAHPKKQKRPIASGSLPIPAAWRAFALIVVVALAGSAWLGWGFAAMAVLYLLKDVAYSLKLKHVAYVDVFLIAAGFELRVVAGSYAANVAPSVWLLVVTFLLALYLAAGKRMHELTQGEAGQKQRSVLKQYSRGTLSTLLYLTAASTIVAYALYTLDPQTTAMFHSRWLVLTTANLAFGVLRFLALVRRDAKSESPTEEMLRDPAFLANGVIAAVAIVAIIYFGVAGG